MVRSFLYPKQFALCGPLVAGLIACSLPVEAATIIADFNDMNLGGMEQSDGQPADTGVGFTDSYYNSTSTTQQIVTGDLASTVTGYTSGQSGAARKMSTNATDSQQQGRDTQTLDGSNIWMSFLANLPTSGGRALVGFNTETQGASDPRIGLIGNAATFRGESVVSSAGGYADGETHLVVVRIRPGAGTGGEDFVDVWIDRDVNDQATLLAVTPDIQVTDQDWLVSGAITRINPSAYGATGADAPSLDNIRISDEDNAFEIVTKGVVPEPGAISLIGLGALLLIRSRSSL